MPRHPIHRDELALLAPPPTTLRGRAAAAFDGAVGHAVIALFALAGRPARRPAAVPVPRPRMGEAPKLLCEIAADIEQRHPMSATILRNIADDVDALLHPSSTDPDPATLDDDARAHPACWISGAQGAPGYVHQCHIPSGRTCIEPDCPLPAGTPWGPYWCPDHDAARLNRVSVGLRRAFGAGAIQ